MFVGYDSKSKGYRIYWPRKRSVTVKHDVVFNENNIQSADDSVNIPNGVLSEEEMESEKVIQYSKTHIDNSKGNVNKQPEKESSDNVQDSNTSSTIPFPTVSKPISEPKDKNSKNEHLQKYGKGQRPQKAKGAYKQMNNGLTAAIAHFEDFENKSPCSKEDFTLVATHPSDPKMLDKALRGPDSKHWEEALQYEISQLQKLGTWEVKDLPAGHAPIPCSEVI